MHLQSIEPVPDDTALGSLYTDEAFADLSPTPGQLAEAPWRLAVMPRLAPFLAVAVRGDSL